MGGGNGAKSAKDRERAAGKGPKVAASQLKSNEAAQSIQCFICKQTFQKTSPRPQLAIHSDNKHPKQTFADCFPSFPTA